MKRALLTLILWFIGLSALAADLVPLRLAEGVYALVAGEDKASPENGGFTANGGFLVGRTGVVVVNPGPSRRHGEALERAIARITPLPVTLVLETHARPELVMATGWFREKGVPVLAHADTVRLMRERCQRCLERLREAVGVEGLRGTDIALPLPLLSDGLVLDGGGRPLLVVASGDAMIPGGVAILDRESGVLFAGALFNLGYVPTLADADSERLLPALDRLAALPATVVVPDRGAPGPLARMAQFRRYISGLRDKVGEAYRQGVSLSEVEAAAELPEFAGWQGYPEHHGANARALYLRLEEADLSGR